MTELEKKMIEALARSEENIQIPDSVNPENIEELLMKREKKAVWWKNRRIYGALAACLVLVVSIGVFTTGMPRSENKEAALIETEEELQMADTYEEVYKYIQGYQEEIEVEKETVLEKLFSWGSKSDEMMSGTSSNESAKLEYSSEATDTNVRTEGVGEADVVKTNGKYLFVLSENQTEISIVDADSDKMSILGQIEARKDNLIREFYVYKDRVYAFVVTQGDKWTDVATYVATYDISDVKSPALLAETEQSGFYHSSRIVGEFIYTFSEYSVHANGPENIEEYVPKAGTLLIPEADIILPEMNARKYVVMTAINTESPDKITDQKAILNRYGNLYVSTENIYFYEENSGQTVIHRIGYKDGMFTEAVKGRVDGWINDSFCIDEYEGNLRIVTTVSGKRTTTNSVYVLDKELEIIGEINGIAKDERVYSARFFGKIGYFVTYRETDPLFSVDFSNPKHPEIIGKLKIPGFSEYLHFYGKDQLLGIGMDTEEDTGVTNGVKVSMFDISDPTDVKEKHSYTIEDMYDSAVFWDYKAVLVDYDNNMIGFSCTSNKEIYYVFGHDSEDGFYIRMEEEVNGTSYQSTRGVRVKNRFYVIHGNTIESYNMHNFEKIDDIIL